MLRRYRTLIIITTLLTLAPMIAGLVLWDRLPDVIATHFGINGEPNGWSSKAMTVFGIPAILAACEVFCAVMMSIDPKSKNIASKPLIVVLIMMPALSWFLALVVYAAALGVKLNIGALCSIFIGVLFIFLGNYMPKNARNYSFGVRTPWSLDDDENWAYSNRIGSICFMVTGILTLIAGVLTLKTEGLALASFIVIMAGAFVSSVITMLSSYLYYKKHGKKEAEAEDGPQA